MAGPRCSWVGPRVLLLLLLVVILYLCECEAANKNKSCKYNGKKYKAGEVIEALEDNCIEFKCSKKGKNMVLELMKNCVCGKEGEREEETKTINDFMDDANITINEKSAKKKKPCKYNRKKFKPGEVIEALEDNCVELKCSKKGKKTELELMKNCVCGKEASTTLPTTKEASTTQEPTTTVAPVTENPPSTTPPTTKEASTTQEPTTTVAPVTENPHPSPSFGGTSVAGLCIIINEDSKTWTEAKVSCAAKGQRLAVLQDHVVVKAYLQNNYAGKVIWLGASDIDKEGNWLWINGRPVQSWLWPSPQPDNRGGQDCLSWGYRNNYDDQVCTRTFPYMCELEASSSR